MESYFDIIRRISDGKYIIPALNRGDTIAPADIIFNTYQTYDDMFDPIYNYSIIDTEKLVRIVDMARINKGYKPMFGDNNDEDCWYDFEIMLDKHSGDVCITALVCNSECEDDKRYWIIQICDFEKEYIMGMIDEYERLVDRW